MFLKTIRRGESSESLYECKRLHTRWNRKNGEPIRFDLEDDSTLNTVSLTIDDKIPVDIYIMNHDGKTIERIEYKPKANDT